MPDEASTEVSPESGSALRTQLEQEIAQKRAALEENQRLASTVVILQHGLDRVKPEDLTGVPTEQLAAKAAEIHQARVAEEEAIFARVAAAKGIKLDGVPTSTTEAVTPLPDGLIRASSLGTLGGVPIGQLKPQPQTADEMIMNGL